MTSTAETRCNVAYSQGEMKRYHARREVVFIGGEITRKQSILISKKQQWEHARVGPIPISFSPTI
jgi:hypothetical protein